MLIVALFSCISTIHVHVASAETGDTPNNTRESSEILQVITISGKVNSKEENSGLPAVNVIIKGTSSGTVTDVNGSYTIQVPSRESVLVFSSVGYATEEVTVGNKSVIDLTMTLDVTALSEVVVVGYGEQRKETLTGAVSTVDSKVYKDRGVVSNPLSSLQGQLPGVVVTRGSAAPGQEDWAFQIRGAISVNGTSPLVLVDDVPLPNQSALNSINPNDIDNITVLKDASAAIYGARAAGGVVLITTKQAMTGKPRISYDASVSQQRMGLRPGMLGADDYGKYLLEAISNASTDGEPDENWIWTKYARAWMNRPASGYIDKNVPGYVDDIGFTDVRDYTFFDTNPIDMLWKNTAISTTHDLNFSARTDVMGYRLSLGYLNQGSLLKWGESSFNRYNLNLAFDYKFSERLKMKTNFSLQRTDVVSPRRQGEINFGSQPGFPESTVNGKPYAWGTQPGRNWLLELGGEDVDTNNNLFLNTKLEYKVARNLNLVGVVGYTNLNIERQQHHKFIPEIFNYTETYQYQGNPRQDQSWYSRGFGKEVYFTSNAYLEYKKKFNEVHDVKVMAGVNYEKDEFSLFSATTNYLASNDVPWLGGGLGDNTTKSNSENRAQWAIGSAFSRINYGYKDKYLLTFIARTDGSSRFDADNKWTVYSGVEAAWRISQENFMKDVNFLDELKIRGSYGTMGNNQVAGLGFYDHIQLVDLNNQGPILGGYTSRSVTAGPSGTLRSTNTTWERIQSKNLAVDFGVMGNRLFGTFDYFWKENKNMFLRETYPAVLGATPALENIGHLKVWGWEASLGWRDKKGDFYYMINGAISDNDNKIVDLKGANIVTAGLHNIQGYPINSYFGLQYDGRIQTDEEAQQYALLMPGSSITNRPSETQIIKGINRFKDVNGDGRLTNAGADQYLLGLTDANGNPIPDGDIVYLGRSDPRYSFALNMYTEWKGFDFSVVFQGIGQRHIYRRSDWSTPFGTIWQGHGDWWVGKTWTPENPDAELPILTTATNRGFGGYAGYNYQISNWALENGAYVRLKNISLGYTVPQEISRKIKLERLRVYTGGNDIAEWSAIKDGWDPEQHNAVSGGSRRYPFYRMVTFGLNATF